MPTLRVTTNMPGLLTAQVAGVEVTARPWPRHLGLWAPFVVFFRSFRDDYVLLNGSPRNILILTALRVLWPWHPCRIVVLDLLLSEPRSRLDRIKTRLRTFLLRRVHRILLYYRDTSALQACTGLSASTFAYVPFKINQYDMVTTIAPTDEGYVFCGGKTRRDFKTLIAAMEGLPFCAKIVTAANEDLARHGSYLDENLDLPPNVEVVRLDAAPERFVPMMAASRLVVLPLIPDITGVGIGVYIMAMALGKCVVISDGPSTRGILTPDMALVVPASDPVALRNALREAYENESLRTCVAEAGQRYALALGDESHLLVNLVKWLAADRAARAS